MTFMGELWKKLTGSKAEQVVRDNKAAHLRLRRKLCTAHDLDMEFDEIDRILRRNMGGNHGDSRNLAGQR